MKSMFAQEVLFWNVDTQVDFMSPEGKLYVSDSEKIQPILKQITDFAKQNNIQVVNTADYHFSNSSELSDKPDFINTFPPHCMADTTGAEYVPETQPETPVSELFWNTLYSDTELKNAIANRNLIIRKDAFDVFKGNPNTETLVKQISPKKVFIYGVTTNVCVDCAVVGLADRNIQVYVIKDAIKELPNIPLPFDKWDAKGVKRILFSDLENYID